MNPCLPVNRHLWMILAYGDKKRYEIPEDDNLHLYVFSSSFQPSVNMILLNLCFQTQQSNQPPDEQKGNSWIPQISSFPPQTSDSDQRDFDGRHFLENRNDNNRDQYMDQRQDFHERPNEGYRDNFRDNQKGYDSYNSNQNGDYGRHDRNNDRNTGNRGNWRGRGRGRPY